VPITHGSVLEAERLALRVADGHPLPVVPSPVQLDQGEMLHARLDAEGWRFHSVDVVYEQERMFAGGVVTFGLAAALAGLGNRRTRRRASELAAPQWRPLGWMPVLATNERLLALHEGVWQSVWYSGICQLIPRPADGYLELRFEADPPYLLSGEWVPYLTVVVTTALAQTYGVDAVATILQVA
jgi:hypothetical protein